MASCTATWELLQTDDGVHTDGDGGTSGREKHRSGRTSALRAWYGLETSHADGPYTAVWSFFYFADHYHVVGRRMLHMCWTLSDGSSKLISIDEQPNH